MNTHPFPAAQRTIIMPHKADVPRVGEGAAVNLPNGKVLLVVSRFTGGGADHDRADLYGGILNQNNGQMTNRKVFFPAEDALNQMSVSLERLSNGDLGFVFIRKLSPRHDHIFFSRSSDHGVTWSEPVRVNSAVPDQYIVVNNDRLRQFSSGRLALPAALYPSGDLNVCSLGIFYSDDAGKSWQLSERSKIMPENMLLPHRLAPGAHAAWKECCWHAACQQEPGVEELDDGCILLYCRTTLGYMYQAFSENEGENWSDLRPAREIISPCAPQSIRRIPGSKRLLCVFNDRHEIPFGDEEQHWHWRTPLTLAASDDNASSWQILGNIEDDSHNYCYTSILFVEHNLLLTYYESENSIQNDELVRRNLASLKMQLIPLSELRCD